MDPAGRPSPLAVPGRTDSVNWTTLTNTVAGAHGLPAGIGIGVRENEPHFHRTVTPGSAA